MTSQLAELRRPNAQHDCVGRCSGRLRIVAGRLVRELVCDDCGKPNQTLPAVAYQVPNAQEAAA